MSFIDLSMDCSSLTIFFLIAGPRVVGNLFLEVIRAFYSYCRDALGSDLKLSYTQSGNSLIRYGFGFGPQLRASSPLPNGASLISQLFIRSCVGLEKVGVQRITPLMKITDALESVTVNGPFPVGNCEEFQRYLS